MAGWINMPLGTEVGLDPSNIVLDGEPAALPKKGQSPQFSAHLYCRQAAGCIKMPLGMEVGLSPGDFVLDGNPASPHLNGHSPQFLSNVRCVQTTGWMKTPLGTEVDLGPGHIVLDGFPALREWGTALPPPLLGPCLLWPRSPISATAELLFTSMVVVIVKMASFLNAKVATR